MAYLLRFEDPLAARTELSGGKGANLAALTRRGFPVPEGFIVTAPAYRDFIRGGAAALARVEGFSFDDPAKLRDESGALRRALSELPLPDGLAEEIDVLLGSHPAGQAFSVRSSSTMEDLAAAAFAGQHDTYLNCRGREAVVDRVKACFVSLWQDRAIAYRRRQGFDHAAAAMAVVVQRMIPCEVAGVAFSLNPVSGDLGEIVVDANFGLGESVVSGEGEVDHFVLDKARREVKTSRIAAKTRRVVGRLEGGTREEEVEPALASRPCLDPAQLAALADLVVRVERSYAFPQDIEWGFVKDRLYLLQSRPVTAVPPRWTRDESAERFPNVLTPLTWDFVEEGFHRSLEHSFRLLDLPAFRGKWFGLHDHYVYGNQNAVELYARRDPLSIRSLDELRGAVPRMRESYAWVQELPVRWSRDLDDYLIRIGRFMAEPLEGLDLRGVWDFVLRVSEHGTRYFSSNIAISIAQGALVRLARGLLRLVPAEELFDDLMAFCETKTGAINKELFELARLVKAHPEFEALFRSVDARTLVADGLLARSPAFEAAFQDFQRAHGHRELDFDMYHATWLEAPWAVLDSVKLVLGTSMSPAPAERERELKIRQRRAEVELLRKLPEDLHYFYMEILRLARVYTSLDDLEHYQTTRLTLPMRRGLRELGGRLARAGVLDDPMDVFFARKAELAEAVAADNWSAIADAVRKEKRAYLEHRGRSPAWVPGGPAEEVAPADLSGLPGSPGEAEGRVCVVSSPEDFARFTKGSVLVARTTNPTWTPLFYGAAAVITESGGPLSHGAVTAREMRIPAVMAVRGCLTRLKNGDRVRVDGARGRITLL